MHAAGGVAVQYLLPCSERLIPVEVSFLDLVGYWVYLPLMLTLWNQLITWSEGSCTWRQSAGESQGSGQSSVGT
jgi:hypothetical protein